MALEKPQNLRDMKPLAKMSRTPVLNDDIDLLMVTLPRRNPHIYYATQVPEALARLKATCQEANIGTTCVDFDNLYFHHILHRNDIYDEMDEYFRDTNDRRFQGQKEKRLSKDALRWYENYLETIVDRLDEFDFEWLGVSVFSEQSVRCTIDFLERVRVKYPDIKIVSGGYSMIIPSHHHGEHVDAQDLPPMKVGEYLKHLGLVDHFITGEGEVSLVKLIEGETDYPGIDNFEPEQLTDLNMVFPDYSDFDFRRYIFPNPNDLPNLLFPMMSVTGSRGCVRNCVFCDINTKWPKYQWVGPENLAKEIIYYYEQYGITNFHWSDSLVNGSPTMMAETLKYIVDYLEKHNIQFWQTGSFIVRTEKQMPEEHYALLKRAGFDVCTFGLEAGSEHVRTTMKKWFPDEAAYFTVEMCRKYDIECQFLMMPGYPTERNEDHEATLKMMKDFAPRYEGDRSVIWSLSSFGFEYDWDETPLNRDPSIHNITMDPVLGWKSPDCNNYLAMKRTKAIYQFLEDLGYPSYSEWRHENQSDIDYIEQCLREAGREDELLSEDIIPVQKKPEYYTTQGLHDYVRGGDQTLHELGIGKKWKEK